MPGPKEKILHLLKTKGPQSSPDLAARLDVTSMAVRQHLGGLRDDGLVDFRDEPKGVGRPRRIWELTRASADRFPDSHDELALGMIDAVRRAFGAEGLEKLIRERVNAQAAAYRARMPDDLPGRVRMLSRIRSEEGYLAECKKEKDGSWTLAENHCPICAAAEVCQGLCAGELDLFRRVLGRGVKVERTEHLLDGARRCVYRIQASRSA
ncbi:MAG: helix-turn-helix transcriptional regulator [Planctomycetota bacterium]|jgi:predicted ArsR family transcriptional regulator